MSVLVDEKTRVLIQGITGKQGSYHTRRMLEYKMNVVAGVSPGKKGNRVSGVPVYNCVAEAVDSHRIDASLVMVPPPFVLEAASQAINSRIPLVVIITEHVPVHDTMRIRDLAISKNVMVVGPNTIGVISPGKGKVGIMPGYIYSRGNVGVISRSGTLTHEISSNLTFRGIGQSSCIGIGGDIVSGIGFVEALELFRNDPETEVVVLIGEIGGVGEEVAAKFISETCYPKPVVAFIAGLSAPEGKKMGHAGAIVGKNYGSAESKIETFRSSGVDVADTLDDILQIVGKIIKAESPGMP
ncbi:MAG: succinate--CoA ligase subunit alpha [Synergistales bacterium]|nr:succinate--CoA ligase subunit alpha [Synergistales bacterium]MDI9392244.1 succinate--CoA ligase subunit alpha [Synergistota bacterium]